MGLDLADGEIHIVDGDGNPWWVTLILLLFVAFFLFSIAAKWDNWARPTQGMTVSESGPLCFCGCGMYVADWAEWTGKKSNDLGLLMNKAFSDWVTILSIREMISVEMQAGHESKFIQDGWGDWKELRKETHLGHWPDKDLKKRVNRWLAFSDSAIQDLRRSMVFSSLSLDSLPECLPIEIEAWVENGTQPTWLIHRYRYGANEWWG